MASRTVSSYRRLVSSFALARSSRLCASLSFVLDSDRPNMSSYASSSSSSAVRCLLSSRSEPNKSASSAFNRRLRSVSRSSRSLSLSSSSVLLHSSLLQLLIVTALTQLH